MSLCSSNFSIGVYDRTSDLIVQLKKHEINGILGSHLDRLLIKNERLCTFHSVYDFGIKLPNNSYPNRTAMYLISNGLIDIYSRPESIFLYPNDENFIDMTQSVRSEPFQIGQFLNEIESSKTTSLDFLIQNLRLVSLICFGYLITIFIALIFNLFSNQLNKLKKNLIKLILLNKLVNKFILLFYSIFVFILIIILTNLIKTEKVVLDTSDVLYSESQLIRTKKIACWIENEFDFMLAKSAPKNTLIFKIYNEKKFKKEIKNSKGYKSKFCLINNQVDFDRINLHLSLGLHNYFLFISKTTLLVIINYITTIIKGLIFFNNDVNYFEQLLVHYEPKYFNDLNRKKYLNMKLLDYFEKGFYIDIFNKFHNTLNEFLGKSAKVYSSLDNYIEDRSVIENIKLNYFENLLIYLILIELILFSICIIYKLIISKIKKLPFVLDN